MRKQWVRARTCALVAIGVLALGAPRAMAATPARGYELVSPTQKNGGDVMGVPNRTRAAADGSAVQFASLSGFSDTQGNGIAFEYMAQRDGAAGTQGWSTHAIGPPHTDSLWALDTVVGGLEPRYMGELSSDLRRGVFLSKTLLVSNAPNVDGLPNLFLRADLRTSGAGTYQLVSDCPGCTSPLSGTPVDQPALAGASDDYSHLIFESVQSLTADAVGSDPSAAKLYEWANGTVRLAGILPDDECGGAPPCAAPRSQAGRGALYGSSVGASSLRQYTPNAISRDGSRIFFTVAGADPLSGQLYMRIDNSTANPSTVHVNLSERTSPDPTALDATYWNATPDGSKIFFTTKENLIDSDNSDTNLADLYMYDATAPAGHHLTLVSISDPGQAADVQGVLGLGDSGHWVYFLSTQQLLSGLPTGGNRIFVWHDGVVRQVARVPGLDVAPLLGENWLFDPKASRVTPDGLRMAFATRGTDEMPHPGGSDVCQDEGGCREVYLYDAAADSEAGRLTCLSCHASASAPSQTDASLYQRVGRGATALTSHLSHVLSDDGRFVFFQTGDRLVSGDNDGATSDVYQYDALSGALSLISTGKAGSFGATFLDASADGQDVFFVTRDRLVGWDSDDQADLYDARVGGGFPDPRRAPVACSGDACFGPAAGTPTFPAAGSRTFAGAGNKAKNVHHKCKKKQVRRRVHGRVRCVTHRHHRHGARKAMAWKGSR